MRKVPKFYRQFTKNYPQINEAYENLADECRKAGPLNQKEQALVKLGVSIGARTEGSVHSQVRKGLDAGVKPDEIRHAVFLAMTTIGFPNTMAVMSWANDLLNAAPRRK